LLLLGVLAAVPARAEVVTLRELEKRALSLGTFNEGHEARARASEAEIHKAAAAYYPQVTLRADANLAPGRKLISVCGGRVDSMTGLCTDPTDIYKVQGAKNLSQGGGAFQFQAQYRLELAATAPIYDFGRTKAAVAAGRASHAAVKAERDAEAQTLVQGVRGAYLNWLSAHELVRVSEDAAQDAEDRYARVTALVEQGARPRAELAPAQSDALLTKLELTRARADLEDALASLEDAVGEPLPVAAEPDPSLLDSERALTPLSEATDALSQLIERQRAAAHSLELSYKRQRMPQLGVAVLAGARAQNGYYFPLYSAGVSLFVPLYDGGISAAAAAGARAQQDALDARLRDHGRQQERAYLRAERDARQALEALSIAEELLTVAEKRLSDAQAGYDLGVNGIDLIANARALRRRAQTEVLRARVAHAEARLRFAPIELSPE
jgi:outer membrane protein